MVVSGKMWWQMYRGLRGDYMLIGEYNHNLDVKGRLIIPSKLRLALGDSFVITKGLDGCLFIYPKKEWNIISSKLKELSITNKDARAFVRFFFSGASECSLDKQGRVLIPDNLRQYAGLIKEVMIIGLSTRLEIWNIDKWENYLSIDNLSYENIAEKMTELGI